MYKFFHHHLLHSLFLWLLFYFAQYFSSLILIRVAARMDILRMNEMHVYFYRKITLNWNGFFFPIPLKCHDELWLFASTQFAVIFANYHIRIRVYGSNQPKQSKKWKHKNKAAWIIHYIKRRKKKLRFLLLSTVPYSDAQFYGIIGEWSVSVLTMAWFSTSNYNNNNRSAAEKKENLWHDCSPHTPWRVILQ